MKNYFEELKRFALDIFYWALLNKWRLLVPALCYLAAAQLIPIVGSRYGFTMFILATFVSVTIIRITNID